ncbi:MAG: hypothetical protein C4K60_15050 [Ideonella sp. MAG2]|nr:MAG: hypothetical protein C4K60_15050 [Ideonella sp. MAG2]
MDIFWIGIQYINFLLLRMLGGTIVCTLLLIFANTNKNNSLPISLSIENFWGGLLIGLFSIPVAKWLSIRMSEEIIKTSSKQDPTD